MQERGGEPRCRHLVLPACLSLGLVGPVWRELEQRTGCTIKEVALPCRPSPVACGWGGPQAPLPGPGGTHSPANRVLGARYEGDRVIGVHSQNGDDQLFEANHRARLRSFFTRAGVRLGHSRPSSTPTS